MTNNQLKKRDAQRHNEQYQRTKEHRLAVAMTNDLPAVVRNKSRGVNPRARIVATPSTRRSRRRASILGVAIAATMADIGVQS